MTGRNSKLARAILMVLGAGLLYTGGAMLGEKLQLQPLGSSLAAVQSGLALAAMLAFGWPAALGIFPAAFLFPFLHSPVPAFVFPALAAAAAAVLQAGAGWVLIKRWVGFLPPENVRDVLRSLFILAGVALLPPALTQSLRLAAGALRPEAFFQALWSGWTGELVGLLAVSLFAFTLLNLLQKSARRPTLLFPLISILVGLSLALFTLLQNTELIHRSTQEADDFKELVGVLMESVDFHDTQSLQAVKSLFAASQTVEREEFKTFTAPFLAEYRNTIALTWAPRVLPGQVAEFEAQAASSGVPGYHLYERNLAGEPVDAGYRPEHYPVLYIEPQGPNSALLGFDNASSLQRMRVISEARDSGEPVFSEPLTLLQSGRPETGILLMVPVYTNGTRVATLEERRENIQGVVVGAFAVRSLVQQAFINLGARDMTLYFYDVSDPGGPLPITAVELGPGRNGLAAGDLPSLDSLLAAGYSKAELVVVNRHWLVISVPGARYQFNDHLLIGWIILSGGLLLTTMFLAYSNNRQRYAVRLQRSENEYRTLSEHALTGIVRFARDGTVQYANPAIAHMFGYPSVQAFQAVPIYQRMRDGEAQRRFFTALPAGKEVVNREVQISVDKENTRQLLFSGSADDEVLSATAVDITERIAAAEKLRQSEAQNRSLLEAIPDLLFRIDRDGRFLSYRAPADSLRFAPPEAFLGRNLQEVLPQPVAQALKQKIEEVFASGKIGTVEYSLAQDGQQRSFEARLVANPDGQEAVVIVRDVTEDRRLQDAVKASEERYRLLSEQLEAKVKERTAEVQDLYNNAPTGYHSLDSSGTYRLVNQTELDWLGYTREELVGKKHATDLLAPASAQHFRDVLPQFHESGVIRDLELDFVRKDGSLLPALVNAKLVRGEDGQVSASRVTVFDNTERKKVQDALQQSRDALRTANEALAKASRLKDEFLASMSHELRTPLTGILGLAEALQMETYGDLNELQRKALVNLESSGRHLLELINDILDLSKIEADRLELQLETCSVSEICQASMQLTKGMAHQKQMQVSFTSSVPTAMLQADPRRLKQMVVNLLSNSIKYTPAGGQLGIEVDGSEAEGSLSITVWDKGAGIKPEDLGKLFQPFTQLDTSLSRTQAGTGLGLSLVSRLAEMHGGSVSVVSVYGEGSRFTLHLPWNAEAAAPAAEEAERVRQFQRCVLVEDVDLHQKQIGDYLQRLGIEFLAYRQGKGALEAVTNFHPDFVLLDLGLPDLPGDEVLVALKQDPRTASIPVIISSVEEEQQRLIRLGADAYLVKPYQMEELRQALERIRPGWLAPHALAEGLGKVTVLLADDNEIVLDTMTAFLRQQGFEVAAVRDGRSLVDQLEGVDPDIILTDIQMPGTDGLTAIREIRALPSRQHAGLPIVAITALAMPGDKEMCLAAGADHYLTKPLRLEKLAAFIREVVAESRRKQGEGV